MWSDRSSDPTDVQYCKRNPTHWVRKQVSIFHSFLLKLGSTHYCNSSKRINCVARSKISRRSWCNSLYRGSPYIATCLLDTILGCGKGRARLLLPFPAQMRVGWKDTAKLVDEPLAVFTHEMSNCIITLNKMWRGRDQKTTITKTSSKRVHQIILRSTESSILWGDLMIKVM